MASKRPSLRGLIEKTRNSWQASQGVYDFSHEVKESMSGCLACKACSTQCPIKLMCRGSAPVSFNCITPAITAHYVTT